MKAAPNTSQVSVVAVIVHYGAPAATTDLANHLRTTLTKVVIVANDGRPRPGRLADDVKWLIPERNLGFGGAVNWVVRNVFGDVYLVLNPDVLITPEAVRSCLTWFEDEQVGVVAPTLLKLGDAQSAIGTLAKFTRWPRQSKARPKPNGGSEATWVTGAAMFVRRSVLEGLGFEGTYFLIFEDVDLCLRAGRAGWRIVCTGDTVEHPQQKGHSLVGGMSEYYIVRNYLWFAHRNFGVFAFAVACLGGGILTLRGLVAALARGRNLESFRLRVAGLRAGLRPPPPRSSEPVSGEPVARFLTSWRGDFRPPEVNRRAPRG